MTVHIVGAGLSGLAAAVELAGEAVPVALYEAAAQAGGRCRSYFDRALGRVIDNGNHLVLSGNRNTLRYLGRIGAADRLVGPEGEGFRFLDLLKQREFRVRPNPGPIPWWILSPSRRVPDTLPGDYLVALRLLLADENAVAADVMNHDELYRILWEPLIVSALNTPANEASARGFGRVLAKTLLRGGAMARPLVAKRDLADSFVTPALDYLAARDCRLRTVARLKRLALDGDRVTALVFEDGEEAVAAADRIILAVPPSAAERLIPGLEAPTADESIVNAHFATADPEGTPIEIVAIVGGEAQWVFRRPGIASVTVSAARGMVDAAAEEIAPRLWADVARAFPALGREMPVFRVVKEKRATIRQTPADEGLRPGSETGLANLWLAGDWTCTGLPATIEGSILSGFRAAALVRAAGRG